MFNLITVEDVYLIETEDDKDRYDEDGILMMVETTVDNIPIEAAVRYILSELECGNYHSSGDMFEKLWNVIQEHADEETQKRILFEVIENNAYMPY